MSIENFCIPVDFLPTLDDGSCESVLEYYNKNLHRFNSYDTVNGKTVAVKGITRIGFSSLRLSDYEEGRKFGHGLLEKNKIFLNYENICVVLQRSYYRLVPHTDPGRNVSLIFNIIGPAITNFYEMENFVPNIDYSNTKLYLRGSIEMNLRSWYLFNNAAIHAVEKIPKLLRIALVIHLGEKFDNFEVAKKNLTDILK